MNENKLRVFIAEDEPIELMGFQAVVAGLGHIVAGTATDGKTAVERITELKPDVAVMDINMPGMDGIAAAEQIQKVYELPIIIVTGYRNVDFIDRAFAAGVYGYLQKPIDEYELHSVLKIAVAKFQKLHQAEAEKKAAEKRLEERKLVERAKGMLMEQFGLSEPQAMKALQKRSADANKKLCVIAKEMLEIGGKL